VSLIKSFFTEHFQSCRGALCRCENIGYKYLFCIAIFFASLESSIAWYLADSLAAGADASHAYLHSSLYAVGIYATRKYYLPHEMQHTKEKLYKVAVFLLLGVMAIIAYHAVVKLYSPREVLAGLMITGVSLGIIGSVIQLALLKKIKIVKNKSDKFHSIMSLDAMLDLLVSLAVLVSAFFVSFFRWLDPVITLAACGVIGYKAIQLLRNTGGHSH
jgi:Co/Zn/Cd efflux system component